jgi:site-specific DNA-methyltransferase (adenine-specific)/modification methylase
MKRLPDKSIDLIYFNPPYAITAQWWDEPLDWVQIFKESTRLLKPTGNLVIHCSIPFNYHLIRLAPTAPSYSFYWNKINHTTPLLCNTQPLRCVEEILVWRMKKGVFYPVKTGTEVIIKKKTTVNSKYVNDCKVIENIKYVGKYATHYIEMKTRVKGFSTRPEELIEKIYKFYTKPGDTVLDPTAYHGISGKVAKRLERNWIGCDLNF